MNLRELKIFNSQHGMILLIGIILVILLSGFILITYFFDHDFANKISAMVVTNVLIGRVPSLSLGYASGLSHFDVIVTNIYIEMVMVTLIYSAFVFSYNNILKIRFLETFFHKVKEYRSKYTSLFEKYGILGLFIFVFIPFWMTGPIVGAIIGYLIGLRHFTIIFTVFIATILAITLWGLLLNELISFMNMIDSSLIWFILVFIIVLALLVRLFTQKKKEF